MRLNPLHAPDEALRFLMRFSELDLHAASASALRDLTRDISFFLDRTTPTGGAPGLDVRQLVRMQRRVLKLLRGIAEHNADPVKHGIEVVGVRARLKTFVLVRNAGDVRFTFAPLGPPGERMVHNAGLLFQEVGSDKIATCPAPECGRLFLKVTQKKFCSPRCQGRIYMRERRAEERAEQARTMKGGRRGGAKAR